MGEPVRWKGSADLFKAASPLLPEGEANAKGEASGVMERTLFVRALLTPAFLIHNAQYPISII